MLVVQPVSSSFQGIAFYFILLRSLSSFLLSICVGQIGLLTDRESADSALGAEVMSIDFFLVSHAVNGFCCARL